MTQTTGYVLTQDLPTIPAKRYFTIGEVSVLCGVRSYVLRYWEQEFIQLRPMKRRGNRRYYQHHEVLLVRKIRELLYEQGYTIQGARQQLEHKGVAAPAIESFDLLEDNVPELDALESEESEPLLPQAMPTQIVTTLSGIDQLIADLRVVRELLKQP